MQKNVFYCINANFHGICNFQLLYFLTVMNIRAYFIKLIFTSFYYWTFYSYLPALIAYLQFYTALRCLYSIAYFEVAMHCHTLRNRVRHKQISFFPQYGHEKNRSPIKLAFHRHDRRASRHNNARLRHSIRRNSIATVPSNGGGHRQSFGSACLLSRESS